MAFVRKCPKCGLEVTDTSASSCPACGTSLPIRAGGRIWVGALVQFVFVMTFMLLFRFPKPMIALFGGIILIGAIISSFVKPSLTRNIQPQKPLARPVLFRFVGAGIALCSVAIFSVLLFGFVIFMNSWNRWHQYEGQPFHRSEFQVEQVYRQKSGKSIDVYARGTVEGQREWMSLRPYVRAIPRSQAELEERVPVGVVIPIYFFPNLKGRARVELYQELPPAEASHREAITAVNDSLLGLAIAGALLFVLTRVRRVCYAERNASLQEAALVR
jgi:hypothetical protein